MKVELRDAIFNSLSNKQKLFLNERMERSRRTVFAQALAKKKGALTPPNATYEEIEKHVDEWIYVKCIDAGKISEEHRCLCGRPLRYQHIVRHVTTGEELAFGIDHLQDHLKIDAKTVHMIQKGFDVLDRELNEILKKYQDSWKLEDHVITPFPEGFQMPEDMREHLLLYLPLLDRQVMKLQKLLIEHRNRTGRGSSEVKHQYVVNTNMVQGSLFDDIVPEPANVVNFNEIDYEDHFIPKAFRLSTYHQKVVLECLAKNVTSTRTITEILIKHHEGSGKRFSTGKPDLYINVCFFLDSLVVQGIAHFISGNQKDREYKLIS